MSQNEDKVRRFNGGRGRAGNSGKTRDSNGSKNDQKRFKRDDDEYEPHRRDKRQGKFSSRSNESGKRRSSGNENNQRSSQGQNKRDNYEWKDWINTNDKNEKGSKATKNDRFSDGGDDSGNESWFGGMKKGSSETNQNQKSGRGKKQDANGWMGQSKGPGTSNNRDTKFEDKLQGGQNKKSNDVWYDAPGEDMNAFRKERGPPGKNRGIVDKYDNGDYDWLLEKGKDFNLQDDNDYSWLWDENNLDPTHGQWNESDYDRDWREYTNYTETGGDINYWDSTDDMGFEDPMSSWGDNFNDKWWEDEGHHLRNIFNEDRFDEREIMNTLNKRNRNHQSENSGRNVIGKKRNQNKWSQRKHDFDQGVSGGFRFLKNMMKCDEQPSCGKNGWMQEISSCICQSFWSKNSDPTGKLCQAIPKATRIKAVEVIGMFMKGNGPAMPKNRMMLRQLNRLGSMWGDKFERLISMPFEKADLQVSIWLFMRFKGYSYYSNPSLGYI